MPAFRLTGGRERWTRLRRSAWPSPSLPLMSNFSSASRDVEVGACRRNLLQLFSFQDSDASSFQPNPSALRPSAQLLVGALPRPADNLADLALRDRQLCCGL